MTPIPSVRALLDGAIDYAGTFPPAGLSLNEAAATYAGARRSAEAWLLGRMVVGESHLDELHSALALLTGLKASATPTDETNAWATPAEVTVVMGVGAAPPDPARLAGYNERWAGRARIESFEMAPATVDEIRRFADRLGPLGDSARALYHSPGWHEIRRWHRASALSVDVFFETPLDETLETRLDAIAKAGACAKVRTGGTVASAIPAADALARFLRACADRGLAFKATAGLHHAVRSCYSLTYERDSSTAVMHGFLNVSIAAALARQGASVRDLAEALSESSAAAFEFRPEAVAYRGSTIPLEDLAATRRAFRSFGSCSFREPVEELTRLRLV